MLTDSLLELALLLLLCLGLLAGGLAALLVVVRAAVEGGVRRALPDAALRPSVRDVSGSGRPRATALFRARDPRPGDPLWEAAAGSRTADAHSRSPARHMIGCGDQAAARAGPIPKTRSPPHD